MKIKFNALNSLCWFKFRLKNNFLKQKNADKNSHAKPFRKKFWILTFWILFVSDFTNLTLNFKMLLTKNTVETESNWPITAKLPHHITSVLQKRGWISLALKVSSLLVAKNHFVFYFFVILKKRKWFLLGKEFIESFELLSPAFAKPFPVMPNATNDRANNNGRTKNIPQLKTDKNKNCKFTEWNRKRNWR